MTAPLLSDGLDPPLPSTQQLNRASACIHKQHWLVQKIEGRQNRPDRILNNMLFLKKKKNQ